MAPETAVSFPRLRIVLVAAAALVVLTATAPAADAAPVKKPKPVTVVAVPSTVTAPANYWNGQLVSVPVGFASAPPRKGVTVTIKTRDGSMQAGRDYERYRSTVIVSARHPQDELSVYVNKQPYGSMFRDFWLDVETTNGAQVTNKSIHVVVGAFECLISNSFNARVSFPKVPGATGYHLKLVNYYTGQVMVDRDFALGDASDRGTHLRLTASLDLPSEYRAQLDIKGLEPHTFTAGVCLKTGNPGGGTVIRPG